MLTPPRPGAASQLETPLRWEITTALLQFPRVGADGTPIEQCGADEWAKRLRQVQRAGFSAVDLTDTWLRIADLDRGRLAELGEVLEEFRLRVSSVSLVRRSVIDGNDGESNVDYSIRAVEAAAALGASVVSLGLHQALTVEQQKALWFWTVPGYSDPDDDAARRLAATRFRRIAERAADLGVEISLEMYEDTFLGTADAALALLEAIDHPAVGLNPDVGNLVRAQGPVEDWEYVLTKTLPYSNFWHIKNYFRMEDPAHQVVLTAPAPLEFGFINYRRAIEIAAASGFDGLLCVEHYGGDGLSVSRTNADYLAQLMLEIEE